MAQKAVYVSKVRSLKREGKQHSSETAFLQALVNMTIVTFAFLKQRREHEGVHESVEEGAGDFRACARHAVSSAM